MDILYLSLVFLVIVVIIWMKKPLFMAMIGGILATILLFRVNPVDAVRVLCKQTISWDTIEVLLSFYLIIFLQLMLEGRGRLERAKDSFNRLLRNRRMNTIVSPAVMGLLPSAAVMSICADMVDQTCEEYLDAKEKTFVACFYRHIPEMFLPTFPAVLLGLTLSGQNAGIFVLLMIPMVIVACVIVYFFYLRKIPKEMPPLESASDHKSEVIKLIRNLWTLIAVLLIIIIFNLSVCFAAPIVIVANYILDHFTLKELPDLIVRSAEPILLGNMYLIMLFKGILSYTGVIGLLPSFIGQFPISITMSFALLFFFGTVISGSQAIIALCMPMAFLAYPDGGIPFMVTLMSIAWAAMQISPTHVCSFVAADFFHTTLADIVVKAIPSVIIFSVIAYGYGQLLGFILH
jgi:hypothetical protein